MLGLLTSQHVMLALAPPTDHPHCPGVNCCCASKWKKLSICSGLAPFGVQLQVLHRRRSRLDLLSKRSCQVAFQQAHQSSSAPSWTIGLACHATQKITKNGHGTLWRRDGSVLRTSARHVKLKFHQDVMLHQHRSTWLSKMMFKNGEAHIPLGPLDPQRT